EGGAVQPGSLVRLRKTGLQAKVLPKGGRWKAQVDIKGPELPVARADFIKPHLVNDLLQSVQLVSHQCHAPLPIVNAGRAGDELRNASGKLASDARVAAHQFFPW